MQPEHDYLIIRIMSGGGSTNVAHEYGSSPAEALSRFGRISSLIKEGELYLVIDPKRNANGAQSLFRWGQPSPQPLGAIPVNAKGNPRERSAQALA